VSQAQENGVIYAVSFGKTAFTVPIEMAKDKVINPETLICNGEQLPFTAQSLNKILASNATDYQAAAVASPSYSLKPNELINLIQVAMTEQNYAKAEDALNVLKNANNEAAYAQGFQTYMDGLAKKASVEPKTQCSLIIKSANSQHPICGHTNLPLRKVYQDEFGACRPNYRKNISENFESVVFNSTKILG
jgi:hypothetical protein